AAEFDTHSPKIEGVGQQSDKKTRSDKRPVHGSLPLLGHASVSTIKGKRPVRRARARRPFDLFLVPLAVGSTILDFTA
ncbi:MAG: hypothetical protein ACXU9D_09340, partial [Xanthobacteraceae bacterium]